MISSDRSLSQDTVFDILSNSRRRYVLYYLRQQTEPVQLTTLAEQGSRTPGCRQMIVGRTRPAVAAGLARRSRVVGGKQN